MSKKYRCKNCGSSQLGVSRYQGLEKLFSAFLFMVPLRCRECFQRGMYSDGLFANNIRTGLWTIVGALIVLMFVGSVYKGSNSIAHSANKVQSRDLSVIKPEAMTARQGIVSQGFDNKKPVENEALRPVANAINTELHSSEVPKNVESASYGRANTLPDVGLAGLQANSDVLSAVTPIANDDALSVTGIDKPQSKNKYDDIRLLIEQWRTAWEYGDVDEYLNVYSEDFAPGASLSIKQWRKNRSRIVGKQEFRKIEISDLEFALNQKGTAAGIEFKQQYYSESHSDVVLKRMYIKKRQGEWKITRETVSDIK